MSKSSKITKIPRRIPKYKLPIHGRSWVIYMFTHKDFARHHPDLNGAKMCGLCDPIPGIIYLNKEFGYDAVVSTLFHELTHAWLSNLAGDKGEHEDRVNEEACANLVSAGIIEVLNHKDLLLNWVKRNIKDDDDE